MNRGRITITIGAVLLALAAALALWPALRAGWSAISIASARPSQDPASLRVVAERPGDGELRLRFERPNGAVGHLVLVRDGPDEPWRPEPRIGAPGVLFGDGYPVFATPRFLAVHGLDAGAALRPMDESIADEAADDVTVIQSWGGELAVCFWRHGKVVRTALSGPIFEQVLGGRAAHGAAADGPCAALERLMRDADPDAPRAAACAAVIAACPARRELALERLRELCTGGDPTACDLLLARGEGATELWPEIDDCWRSIVDLLEAAQPR